MRAPRGSQPDKPAHNQGRQALLDAVIDVVAERGLRGATYRAVAQHAGVSYGLVTHHFGSRATMIREALGRSVDSIAYDAVAGNNELDEFGDRFPAYIDEAEKLLAFQYELQMEARRQPGLDTHITQMYTDLQDAIRRRLQEVGISNADDEDASFVLAILDGLVLQQFVFGDRARTTAGLRAMRRYLAGRKAEGG